jgi:hypothetical protein
VLLTVEDARAELQARGFVGWTDARLDRFLRAGVLRVLRGEQSWPFLEAVGTFLSFTTVAGLKAVSEVRVASDRRKLRHARKPELRELGTDTGVAGTPMYWYVGQVGDGGSALGVRVVPYDSGATELWVEYYLDPARDTLTEIWSRIPDDFEHAILDAATLEAAKDAGDWDKVVGLRDDLQSVIASLREDFHTNTAFQNEYVLGETED